MVAVSTTDSTAQHLIPFSSFLWKKPEAAAASAFSTQELEKSSPDWWRIYKIKKTKQQKALAQQHYF